MAGKGSTPRKVNNESYSVNYESIFRNQNTLVDIKSERVDVQRDQCAYCLWSIPLNTRYDKLRCTNDDSPKAWRDVEKTNHCDLFMTNAKGHPTAGENTPNIQPNE